MSVSTKALAGKRIGILGKGGSGKSTITVLLAKSLKKFGYEVCVLDADSTNVGLHKALGLDSPPTSLLDHYGGMIFSGGLVTCPVDDPTPLHEAEKTLGQLTDRYYTQSHDGILFLVAGKIGDLGLGGGCDGPISKIARDFRIRLDSLSPVTLVDFKAGFEDSARGVVTSLDWAVVVVDPTMAAIQMAIHLRDMVKQIKAGSPPATDHLGSPELVELAKLIFREAQIKGVLVALNRIRDQEMEVYLREKLSESGIKPIGMVPEKSAFVISWLHGLPLSIEGVELNVERLVEALETAEENNQFRK